MGPFTELSLFTGFAGITLGLRLAGQRVRTVCYVEIDSYCQRNMQARIRDAMLDDAPIWDDVRTFDGGPWRGTVDIVTAGFPCQPHSIAGRRTGETDDRNLWPDTLRVVSEVRPRYVLLENAGIQLRDGGVPAYAYAVLAELAGIGYDAEWASIPAAAVGAPHERWRWWCLAYPIGGGCREDQHDIRTRQSDAEGLRPDPHAHRQREQQPQGHLAQERRRPGDLGETLPDTEGSRRPERRGTFGTPPQLSGPKHGGEDVSDASIEQVGTSRRPQRGAGGAGWWAVEPAVGRVVDGHPGRVDQLRTIGNGLVPAVVAKFLTVVDRPGQ